MAVLTSLDGHKSVKLLPYRLENNAEDWMLVYLGLHGPGLSFETTGAFLQQQELAQLQQGIRDLVVGRRTEFEFNPLEPNFRFSLRLLEKETFEGHVRYRERFDYEEGELRESRCGAQVLRLSASSRALSAFVEDLSAEIERAV